MKREISILAWNKPLKVIREFINLLVGCEVFFTYEPNPGTIIMHTWNSSSLLAVEELAKLYDIRIVED